MSPATSANVLAVIAKLKALRLAQAVKVLEVPVSLAPAHSPYVLQMIAKVKQQKQEQENLQKLQAWRSSAPIDLNTLRVCGLVASWMVSGFRFSCSPHLSG
jgi:hypothetical protein